LVGFSRAARAVLMAIEVTMIGDVLSLANVV
jgi:hypothetical protein